MIVKALLLKNATGTIENITFQTWKNKTTARKKPLPDQTHITTSQTAHREFMRVYVKWCFALRPVYTTFYKEISKNTHIYNTFIKANYQACKTAYNTNKETFLDFLNITNSNFDLKLNVFEFELHDMLLYKNFCIDAIHNNTSLAHITNFKLTFFVFNTANYNLLLTNTIDCTYNNLIHYEIPFQLPENKILFVYYTTNQITNQISKVNFIYSTEN